MLSENQIMKKPHKVAKPKSNDLLTAINRAFNDGYEKALKDLNNDHVITYEQARNYMTAQHDRTNKI